MLQETYQLDPMDFLKGQIVHKGHIFQSLYSLNLQDFEKLAKMAYNYKWFDNTITFLRPIFANNSTVNKELVLMKNDLLKVHNKLLMTKKARISQNTKIFPFIIDENLDKKSKQQNHSRKSTGNVAELLLNFYVWDQNSK